MGLLGQINGSGMIIIVCVREERDRERSELLQIQELETHVGNC